MLKDWNKEIPTPEGHFLAILVTALIFIFIGGLYLAIFILGRWEAKEAESNREMMR